MYLTMVRHDSWRTTFRHSASALRSPSGPFETASILAANSFTRGLGIWWQLVQLASVMSRELPGGLAANHAAGAASRAAPRTARGIVLQRGMDTPCRALVDPGR